MDVTAGRFCLWVVLSWPLEGPISLSRHLTLILRGIGHVQKTATQQSRTEKAEAGQIQDDCAHFCGLDDLEHRRQSAPGRRRQEIAAGFSPALTAFDCGAFCVCASGGLEASRSRPTFPLHIPCCVSAQPTIESPGVVKTGALFVLVRLRPTPILPRIPDFRLPQRGRRGGAFLCPAQKTPLPIRYPENFWRCKKPGKSIWLRCI